MAQMTRWDTFIKPKPPKVEEQKIWFTTQLDEKNWEVDGAKIETFRELMLQAEQHYGMMYESIWNEVEESMGMDKKKAFKITAAHMGNKLVCLDNSYGGWGTPKVIEYLIPLTFNTAGQMQQQALKFVNDEVLYTYHPYTDSWNPKMPPHNMHYNGNAQVWGYYGETEMSEPIALRELTVDNYGDTIRYQNVTDREIVFDSFETCQVTGNIFVRGIPKLDSAGGFPEGMRPMNPAFPSMAYYLYESMGTSDTSNWWLVKKKAADHGEEVEMIKQKDGDASMTETVIPQASTDSASNDVINGLAKLIAPQIEKSLANHLDEKRVNELIKKALKPKTLEIRNVDTKAVELIESPHKDLERLLYFIQKRHHVYLYGPAGSGKSTAAGQIAKALKLPFGYLSLNPQTPDSRILGFLDAGGTYRKTPFYECYKNGGIFCIDEMDNASASLLTTLNSMLENGYGAFPGELVSRHKDFVLVATGNTNGRGANPMFPERRPFDVAFAERFTFLYWDYDAILERKIALAINPKSEPWLNWVAKAREYTAKNYPKVLVSPRASFKGAEYLLDGKMTAMEIVESLVFKGLDKATIDKITSNVPLPQATTMKAA